jgi:ABC-type glycerol-3-phosphate transport system substrate-binding protein
LSESKSHEKTQTRRQFLKYAGGIAAVVVVGGVAYYAGTQSVPAPTPVSTTSSSITVPVTTAAAVLLNVMKSPHAPDDQQFYQTYENQFAATHPGLKIVWTIPGWGELPTALTSAIAGGNAPDLAYLPTRFIYQWADANALVPLTDLATSDEISTWQNSALPVAWNAGIYKDKVYGIPFLSAAREVVYNVDLMKNAGISTLPTTWDEYYAAAKAITNSATGVYGIGEASNPDTGFNIGAYIWQAGGDYLIVKQDGTTWSGLDSDAALAAATFMQKLFKDGVAMPGFLAWDEIVSAVYAGKIGMAWYDPFPFSYDIMSKYPNIHLNVMGPMEGPDTDASDIGHYRAGYFDFGHWCVFKQSKNPKLAWQLGEFLNADAVQKAYCNHTGLWPCATDLQNIWVNDPTKTFYNAYLTDPVHRKYGRAPSAWDVTAKKVVGSPYAAAVDSILISLTSDLTVVKTDPKTALSKAHESINGVLHAIGAH